MLGHNFFIIQKVIEGKNNGNKIGFPTANMNIDKYIQPKFGVYKSAVEIDNIKYSSISNFGIKPTLSDEKRPVMETHIFNFNKNIYGKKIKLELINFIREEIKFNSIKELKEQIIKDIKKINNNN